MKCAICEKEYKTYNNLSKHIKYYHNIALEDYYKSFISDDNSCKICGKPTKFLNLKNGFSLTCSCSCSWKLNGSEEKRKKTNIEKYGVDSPIKNENILRKKRNTSFEKYGNENFTNSIKRQITIKNKYDDDYYNLKFKEIANRPEVKRKREETCLKKYGNVSFLGTDVCKKISEQKCLEKYGKKHFSSVNIIKEKIKETNIKKYGCWHTQLKENIETVKQTYCEKTGYLTTSQNPDIQKNMIRKYFYKNFYFDSSWELCFYIWALDNNKNISRDVNPFLYIYNGENRYYYPDFKMNDETIEIKGKQFFKDGDPNKSMINPFNRSQDDLYEAKHQCMIANNVKIITDCSEYIDYINIKYGSNYIKRFSVNNIKTIFENRGDFPYIVNKNLSLNNSYRIIQNYHKSVWHAKTNNYKSPFEAWNDEKIMMKVISNRLLYHGENISPNDIRQGLNVTKLAPKVSVFKPSIAKHIVETYLSEYDTVFDPFSGFSGRMLATCDCGKKYIGQDINQTHVKESNEIIKDFNLNATVTYNDIFSSRGEYDCLFTCPPYNLKEQWNENETDMSCDEWIDECLKRFKCKRYVFVVDNTEKYKDKIVETLKNKSHFGTNQEYVILV